MSVIAESVFISPVINKVISNTRHVQVLVGRLELSPAFVFHKQTLPTVVHPAFLLCLASPLLTLL